MFSSLNKSVFDQLSVTIQDIKFKDIKSNKTDKVQRQGGAENHADQTQNKDKG